MPWPVKKYSLVNLETVQSLQNQFVKAVASAGVHVIASYRKIMACINRLCHLQNYLPMQNETINYGCQNFFEN